MLTSFISSVRKHFFNLVWIINAFQKNFLHTFRTFQLIESFYHPISWSQKQKVPQANFLFSVKQNERHAKFLHNTLLTPTHRKHRSLLSVFDLHLTLLYKLSSRLQPPWSQSWFSSKPLKTPKVWENRKILETMNLSWWRKLCPIVAHSWK